VMPSELQNWLENNEPPITLSQAKIGLEEKVRVWSAINKPYQVSLFYKAGPVFLSSEVIIDTPRVVDASFGIHIQGSDE
ncbi:MAG: Pvc16 family protein, partial [Bacillota bacterium]|nr:Pvc16 family protein [Bacillota bacterium]